MLYVQVMPNGKWIENTMKRLWLLKTQSVDNIEMRKVSQFYFLDCYDAQNIRDQRAKSAT